MIIQLQDRVDNQSINSFDMREQTVCSLGGTSQGSPKADTTCREREVVRKGIERRRKQIFQLISVHISQEQVDIALLEKCKTVDVLAVNPAIGNIQRALQKSVSFEGMKAEFCDEVENLLDKAQEWCLNIEELCIQSILQKARPLMWESSLTIFKLLCLRFWKQLSWPIWDGEIVCRRLID